MPLNSNLIFSKFPNFFATFATLRSQSFSLPNDTILYILNNCSSPEVFHKLQKTCKYFLEKKRVIIVDALVYYYKNDARDENLFYFKQDVLDLDYMNINLLENGKVKYWLTNGLKMLEINRRPSFISIFYRCNLKSLKISLQSLTFAEINFLLNENNVEELYLKLVKINYPDGSPVTIDTILEQCPKITSLGYVNVSDNFTVATMERLNALKFVNKLCKFHYGIFEVENNFYNPAFELLCQFVRQTVNRSKVHTFQVYLYESLHGFCDEFQSIFNKNLRGWDCKIYTFNNTSKIKR